MGYHLLLCLRDYWSIELLFIKKLDGCSNYAADATRKVVIFLSATFVVKKSIVLVKK